MSIFYRKEQHRENLFLKDLHLKVKTKHLKQIEGNQIPFTLYLDRFKTYFPCAWEDIVTYCRDKKNDYYRRKRNGLRTVPFYTPEAFLKKHAHIGKALENHLTDEEKSALRKKLLKKAKDQKKAREKFLTDNLVYVQEVCPPYIKDLIKSYFNIRRTKTLNINARYLILLEASQFKCDETIAFLHKISACDKNYDLRMMAYHALRRMGEHPWLARNRKGKKHLSQIKQIDIKENPTELLHLLYENQQALYQSFDVFLSHSSLDTNELLNLKAKLNRQGKTVYIDWINDSVMLNRANQNEDTWNALELRMDQSKTLLYVMTDNSIRSPYTQREVEYFKKLNKPILVYQPHPITAQKPEYLNDCEMINNV